MVDVCNATEHRVCVNSFGGHECRCEAKYEELSNKTCILGTYN